MTTVAEFIHLDGTRVTEKIIGVGGTGIVVQHGQQAIKIPRLSREFGTDGRPLLDESLPPKEGDYDVRSGLLLSLQQEKAIYRRLGDHHGIVRCHNLSSADPSIMMEFMVNGDLRHYLSQHSNPGEGQILSWLTTIAQTLAYIHDRRIILADIRLDNFLLDKQLAIRFTDFGQSTLMPLDWDLRGCDDDGYSVMTDLGQLGAVIFEIATGQSCKFDFVQDLAGDSTSWTHRSSLPLTSAVWLGEVIEKCWTQVFRSAEALATELEVLMQQLIEKDN
ncbi:serine/threonine protein kinase [Capronia coronata CBS 617.96]|uniref:Serine/threonine protein kinase n=1 Tax=Capronia coronata CBS 617.96 TaxID=1182541 RepID=W9YEE1_9EURO|nr:serine/threonine protein kinase [Capronia coronata CBS 617.96]EXJ87641.1 serine/threonine protein kinase [Capronia coronata CBS 617.96]